MLRKHWNDSKKLLTLPNGSSLEFCYAENDKDIERYQGREFNDLGIEEVGQWPESMFRTLHGSNRSTVPGFKPRTLLSANPGGIGHAWLKRIFIERRFNSLERPEDYAFVQALVGDNQALLDNDPDYVYRLQAEPNEALRKAYLLGEWDIFAGQYFSEIRREVHFIKQFPIPHHWNRFGAYDFGFNHPAAFGAFATDEDGNVYQYRELIRAQMRIDQFAKELKTFPDLEKLFPIVAGHDCWTKKNVMNDSSPPTIAEEFMKHDIILKRAIIDRVQGASQVRNYLAWQNLASGRKAPRFYIMDNCPITFDCLTRMQHDPDHVEDVLKTDATEGDPMTGDDPYDMVRYALMSRPVLTDQLPVKHKWGSQEWAKREVDQMEEQAEDFFKKQEDAERGYGLE